MRIALIFVIAVLLSFAADALSLPRAPWRRAPLAFAGHILSVLFLYALFMLLSARPIFSALCLVGLLASMSSLSNPKFATLREPFVFSDLCLYTQVFRYPRFYLPFADIRVTIASGVAVLMLALFCWAEPPVTPHPWLIPLLVMVACVTCGYLMLTYLPLTLDVATDQRRYGFFTVFVAYLLYGLHPSTMRNFRAQVQASPFADDDNAPTHSLQARPSNLVSTAEATDGTNMLPDVIVIQSESYFDARRVSAAIDPSAYTQLDRACSESVVWGKLTVPAWGANTMRSEFSFLTGVASKKLGSARFYPYVFLRRACASLPGWLQRRGYRTLAIHPFHAQFFRRDRVFKQLHFDDFLDISHFEKAPHAGPYVADAAVADAILAALEDGSAQQQMPRFIFAMTMESHGPLHLETVQPGESKSYHTLGDDEKWAGLTIYLRHVKNTDAMIGSLLKRLQARSRPTVVCLYGDHVPSLPDQFRALGKIPKHSAYFIWRNFGPRPAVQQNVRVEALGTMVLAAMQNQNTQDFHDPTSVINASAGRDIPEPPPITRSNRRVAGLFTG